MTDQNDDKDLIAIQEAYANIYNEIVKPDRVFVATQYFRRKWVPLLGPNLAWLIVALRQHCYWSKETGEKRDWCLISQEELAAEVGLSVATVKRLLKQEHAGKFIIDVTHRYRYDSQKRKQVRRKSMYRLRMDDPLIPEDEIRLKELLTEKLSGFNINPETGQVDFKDLLDRLVRNSPDDLQLKLSYTSDQAKIESDQEHLEQPVAELVNQIGQILAGTREQNGVRDLAEAAPYRDAVPVTASDLRQFDLGEEQVLVSWNGNYLAVPIIEIVKQDIRLSGGHLREETRTDCFYSVPDALGEAPEDWLPEEEAKMEHRQRWEQELSQIYQLLGAFSLEEALLQYFRQELVDQFLTGASDNERQRIQAWILYTRKTRNLKNPGGFLRSRLEGDEFPPSA